MMKSRYLCLLLWSSMALAQDTPPTESSGEEDLPQIERFSEEGGGSLTEAIDKENVIYKYKKEDYFDFDALQVQGELITPADLSTRANKRVRFNISDHIRKDFDDFIREDLIDIH